MKYPSLKLAPFIAVLILFCLFTPQFPTLIFARSKANALIPTANAAWLCPPTGGTIGIACNAASLTWTLADLAKKGTDKTLKTIGLPTTTDVVVGGLKGGTNYVITTIFEVIISLGTWLIEVLADLIGPLITAGSFITNNIVITGWSFIQGIANVLFILALLFIALSTTLQLESFNARKLLPRLLLAALLLNFSLILCGILIDFSRLLMAIIARALTDVGVADIGSALVMKSFFLQVQTAMQTSIILENTSGWSSSIITLARLVVVWIFVSGLFMLVIGLIVRYVMLILLLVASPLAFVAWVLPNTKQIAEKWWSNFLKYVFYGPIALFILVLATNIAGNVGGLVKGNGGLEQIVNLVVVITLIYMAGSVGKNLGGTIGAGALGFAIGQGKRFGRLGAKGLYVGTGTRAAVGVAKTAAKREGAYYGKRALHATGLGAVGDYFGQRRKLIDKKRKKDEETRVRTSSGTSAADRIFDPTGYATIQAAKAAGTTVTDPALSAENLLKKGVAASLSRPQREAILKDSDPVADWTSERVTQRKALLQDKEVVRNMDPNEKEKIMRLEVNLPTNLSTNLSTDPTLPLTTRTHNDALNKANAAENKKNSIINKTNEALQRSLSRAVSDIANEK